MSGVISTDHRTQGIPLLCASFTCVLHVVVMEPFAPKFFRLMKGVFAVYKSANVSCATLDSIITNKMIEDLGSMKQRPQRNFIQFLPQVSEPQLPETAASRPDEEQALKARNDLLFQRLPEIVPDWFDHPLVQGPRYSAEDFGLTFGHTLDAASSGVQLVGFRREGKDLLEKLNKFNFPRSYHLHGRFGLASITFDGGGKIVEKSTWHHITETKISRLLCLIQGSFRNALIRNSNLDLESQHAYRMLSKGLVRPNLPSSPTILDIKLHKLDLPDFVVDVTCINESSTYLRKLVHEIGLEMKSSAVCMKVRRYQDAMFLAEDDSTFLTKDLNAQDVSEAIQKNNDILIPILKRRPSFFQNFKITNRKDDENEQEARVSKT